MTRCVSPWRLPSEDDFQNLIDSGKVSEFTLGISGKYWSSTQNSASRAWHLSNGILNINFKANNCDVRCVQPL